MTKTFIIYYQDLPQEQISTDNQTWLQPTGYNNNNHPYFTLNEQEDWCSITVSKNGSWFICFVKLQNHGAPLYFKGFASTNSSKEVIIFLCREVSQDPVTQQWKFKEPSAKHHD